MMSKIEWNKVTWYSKILALALFVALPFIGFYYGTRYGETVALVNNSGVPQGAGGVDYYHNVATWQTTSDTAGGFSIAYPLDFPIDDSAAVSPDWRLNSPESDKGFLFFTLAIPKIFEPQTNFADAKITVGSGKGGDAVRSCLLSDTSGGPVEATSSAMINGVPFTVFHSAGAGAGNYYETTSYRTVHAGKCYAVEYTIHSAQIANYPAEYQLKPFDKMKLTDVLDRIVGTFKFL